MCPARRSAPDGGCKVVGDGRSRQQDQFLRRRQAEYGSASTMGCRGVAQQGNRRGNGCGTRAAAVEQLGINISRRAASERRTVVAQAACDSNSSKACTVVAPLPLPPCRRAADHRRAIAISSPSSTYYAEIRSGDVRLGLGTFETAHEPARVYDAAAWRLGRPCAQMNFHDVYTREHAQDLAPPPRVITEQDHAEHRQQQQRLLIAEEDERRMAEWRRRHPKDVATENAYWAERTARRRAERQDTRVRKLLTVSQWGGVEVGLPFIFSSDDERWEDVFLSTSDSTQSDDSE
ncbi:Protein TRANSPARENT TESTA 12 [Hordeum vulgare]|nr:Protein TRANSPARENT TESTA 12 [Hordeum vulgare]